MRANGARPLPAVRPREIREHEGRQDRAWEELVYQVAADMDAVPADAVWERRGTPDGGIEFSCVFGEGVNRERWAWQAKYLFALTSREFGQLGKSFKDAISNEPDITRYVFVLPINRPSGARGVSAMKLWETYVGQWQELASQRGIDIAIDYRGESEVLRALAQDKHAGTVRYFFDATFLSHDFFRTSISNSLLNLGDRYEASADVGSRVDGVLDAVVLNARFADRVRGLLRQVSSHVAIAANNLGRAGVDVAQLEASMSQFAQSRAECASRLEHGLAPDFDTIAEDLTSTIEQLETSLDEARHAPNPDAAEHHRGAFDPDKPPPPSEQELAFACHRAIGSAHEARDLCMGEAAHAARTGAILLVGSAGSGKSHTLAAHCEARTELGLPTLLALGQNLQPGSSAWSEVLDSLDIVGSHEDLLQGMEVAALSTRCGRSLLVVDAINEGAGQDLWQNRAAGFVASVRAHARVAVIISVRDTYENVVVPEALKADQRLITRVTHPGIQGREGIALERYAARYGLELTDVPGYHPEFVNPLLLKSVCRSALGHGSASLPTTQRGQAWIFDGLIADVDKAVRQPGRLDRDVADQVVLTALQGLARQMNDHGTEALPLTDARSICAAVHDDGKKASRSLLNALVTEGLLLREPAPTGEQVRVTFQRLTDYLRAQDLIERAPTLDQLGQNVRQRLASTDAWSWFGVAASLAGLIPETYGLELLDLVQVEEDDGSAPLPDYTLRELSRRHLETLPWRQASYVTPRTVEITRAAVGHGHIDNYEWIGTLLHLACIPDHPMNVDLVSGRLHELVASERHAWHEIVQSLWLEDDNPVARLIDWVWDPSRTVPPPVRRLAARQLVWFLGCTSRRLRDCATKALISVMDGHTAEVAELLNEFASTDDWYIVERLHAVAYGHVTRLGRESVDQDALMALVEAVRGLAQSHPTTHVLIRYYSSQCFDRMRSLAVRPNDVASLPLTPSGWPLAAPSKVELARRMGVSEQAFRVTPMGYDFREKLLKRSVAEGFIPPDQRRLIANRKARGRRAYLQTFEALEVLLEGRDPAEIADELADVARRPFQRRMRDSMRRIDPRKAIIDTLPDGADDLFRRLEQADRTRRSTQPAHLDADVLERWITARALDLGWVPEAAGGPSERTGFRPPGIDKFETYGKKLVWTAFHELLGVLTDHCQIGRRTDRSDSYRHPWQLPSAVDIDPTIVIRGDVPPEGSTSARLLELESHRAEGAWYRTQHLSPLRPQVPADLAWLQDENDIPTLADSLSCVDPSGERWIVLESHSSWERDKADGSRDPHRHDMWLRTQSYFAAAEDADQIAAWTHGKNWTGLWMPTPPDWGQGWFREYPDSEVWADWLAQSSSERSYDGDVDGLPEWWVVPKRKDFPRAPVTLTTHGSTARADRDHSASDLPQALLPSPVTLDLLGARLAGPQHTSGDRLGLGTAEREYAWLVGDEIAMFASNGGGQGGGTSLLVNARVLSEALARAGWICWTWVLGEKINWVEGEPTSQRMDIFGAAALARSVDQWSLSSEVTLPQDRYTDEEDDATGMESGQLLESVEDAAEVLQLYRALVAEVEALENNDEEDSVEDIDDRGSGRQ